MSPRWAEKGRCYRRTEKEIPLNIDGVSTNQIAANWRRRNVFSTFNRLERRGAEKKSHKFKLVFSKFATKQLKIWTVIQRECFTLVMRKWRKMDFASFSLYCIVFASTVSFYNISLVVAVRLCWRKEVFLLWRETDRQKSF